MMAAASSAASIGVAFHRCCRTRCRGSATAVAHGCEVAGGPDTADPSIHWACCCCCDRSLGITFVIVLILKKHRRISIHVHDARVEKASYLPSSSSSSSSLGRGCCVFRCCRDACLAFCCCCSIGFLRMFISCSSSELSLACTLSSSSSLSSSSLGMHCLLRSLLRGVFFSAWCIACIVRQHSNT